MIKIINIVGARPNFVKIAPLMKAFKARSEIEPLLVHTGQHYDSTLSDLFFTQLGIPKPDINLGVGSGSHAVQTGEIMKAFEPIALQQKPDAVLVVGDVNSTIACGLVAVKLGIKLIHVEAGLRSFDRDMPEEINRLCTDAISDLLFCTEQSGVDNLLREGASPDKVFLTGNVMIDALLQHKAKSDRSDILKRLSLTPKQFAVLTLHRPSNVDDEASFRGILDALEILQLDLPVIFPIHPRTRKQFESDEMKSRLHRLNGLRILEPLGYLDFLKLMSEAKLVLTDSGGIQEETTILQVPCLTLRNNTERPVTVECGTNRVVGNDPQKILSAYRDIKDSSSLSGQRTPPLWDGRAAERIADILVKILIPS